MALRRFPRLLWKAFRQTDSVCSRRRRWQGHAIQEPCPGQGSAAFWGQAICLLLHQRKQQGHTELPRLIHGDAVANGVGNLVGRQESPGGQPGQTRARSQSIVATGCRMACRWIRDPKQASRAYEPASISVNHQPGAENSSGNGAYLTRCSFGRPAGGGIFGGSGSPSWPGTGVLPSASATAPAGSGSKAMPPPFSRA